MNRSNYISQRRQRSRDPLERRMDQWMETGRQLVDGVAGNRPGQRKKDNRSGFSNMGRWVGEKIDWFLEEEEEKWIEPIESRIDSEDYMPVKKRSLTAISLRVPKVLSASSQVDNEIEITEEWPDDDTFRLDKWERNSSKGLSKRNLKRSDKTLNESGVPQRPLPRSSRRRTT